MKLLSQKKQLGIFVFLFCFVIFQQQLVFAQETKKQITGSVSSAKGAPLPGATITEHGTSNLTTTDATGSFRLQVFPGSVVIVSYPGYQNREIRIGKQNSFQVRLTDTASSLAEVVVVGYGTQRKKDITGAVSTVNITEAIKISTNDINSLLQGRASGVAVNSDGPPGAVPGVHIRGFTTFGSANPFYIVDGVPVEGSIRDFSPNDVQTITVLKDAAAASLYGTSAANGVIIITTKQGSKNSPLKVEYNGYCGWDKVWQIKDVTSRKQYQRLNNEARTNAGVPLFPANDPSNPGYIDTIDTDWQKEGLKTGMRQGHSIRLSGGGKNSAYDVSLDYFNNKGTLVGKGPTYKRYTARVNTTAEKGIFKIGETFNYTHSHENLLTFRDDVLLGSIPPLIVSLVTAIPTMPVYDPSLLNGFGGSNSEFNGANSLNAVAVNSVFVNWVDVDRIFGNIYGELQLFRKNAHNLRFRTSLGYDKIQTRDYSWIPAFYFGKFFSNDVARLNDNSGDFTNSSIENTFSYDGSAGKHLIQALLGQSYREFNTAVKETSATGFDEPYFPVIDSGQSKFSKESQTVSAVSSYFGRVNYSYADKYLVSATLRRDGSSRFGPANRFGYFPAVSAGWKISDENFWNVPSCAVSFLKIRASYGKLGNDKIEDYLYQAFINSGIVYIFGGQRIVGGLQTSVVDPNIKWEDKAIINIGFDATFLNNHLDFSAEYYRAKSTDILTGVAIPLSAGSNNTVPLTNAATLENRGYEFSAAYHKPGGKFTFDISANLFTLKNKVLGLGGNEAPIYGVGAKTEIGGEIGEHYGFVYEGIFQTQDEIDNHATQFGGVLAPGDVRYRDISGPEGKPDGIVDDAHDRVYLGSAIPRYYYGINFTASYKKFDFTFFASGSGKFLINSRMYRDLHHSAGALNYSTDMLNSWSPANTNTDIPRLNDADVNNFKDSNRPGWLQDGTYLRITTVSLGYTLPSNIVQGLTSSRLYVTVQNLYSFQKYEGYNPDFTSGIFNPGYDFGSYPKPRTIMLGIQLVF